MDDLNDVPEELRGALDALEARAARAARAVDADRVAARVLERLRTEPVEEVPARRWTWTGMRAAAAVVVLVGAGLIARQVTHHETADEGLALPAVSDSLDRQQAEAVLNAVSQLRASDTTATVGTTVLVDDLTETELRALLQAMQSKTEGS
jgi:hypothetical protein